MKYKSPTFSEFLLEYSEFDTDPARGISEEHDNSEEHYQRYKQAREYIIDMLGKFGEYNSDQAAIWVDRTVRKFNLTDSQKRALEVDVFDWENRNNDEIHENAQLSLPNMKKNFQHIKTSGFRNKKVKAYNEWNNSDQKPGSIVRKTKY